MSIPKTVSEALKQGYRVDYSDQDKISPDEKQITGYYVLVKNGARNLTVPYTARYDFGRPCKDTGSAARK